MSTQIYLDKKELLQWGAGNYSSSWHFLCNSSASSLYTSFVQSYGAIDPFQKMKSKKGVKRAKIDAILYQYYQLNLSGPLLSTIITSAFAVESFIRLCFQLYLNAKYNISKSDRAKGFSDDFIDELATFDRLQFERKYESIINLLSAQPINKELAKRLLALCYFRNDCAHDEPILDLTGGATKRIKRGKAETLNFSEIYSRLYSPLSTSNYPVRPIHALRAVTTHDDFVSHIVNTVKEQYLVSNLSQVIGLQVKNDSKPYLILDFMPAQPEWTLDKLVSFAEFWEKEVQKYVESITWEERRDFILSLKRRVSLKPLQ